MRFGRSQSDGIPGILASLSNITAIIGAIYLAPVLWPLVEGLAISQLYKLYAHDAAYWLSWILHILVYPFVFFAIRLGLTSVITAVTVFATNRLV